MFVLLLIHRVICPSAVTCPETGRGHVDHKTVYPTHGNEICGVRNGSKIKGAPRSRWNMFISKLSKETDDKGIKNFIELLQVTVLELVRVSRDDSVYKSLF